MVKMYPITLSQNIPQGYLELFNSTVEKKMKLENTLERKYQDPISNFSFEGNYIGVYRLGTINKFDLKNTLSEDYSSSNIVTKLYY